MFAGRRSSVRLALCTVAFIVCAAASAHAQGWGVAGGLTMNPDQVTFGGSYELGPITDRVWLQPNAAVGLGNDLTALAVNFDVLYRAWEPRRGPWRLDLGGGPAINHYSVADHADTETGFTLVGLLVHESGWITEMRLGFFDSPDLRFGLGYRFGAHHGRRAPRQVGRK